MTTHTPTPAAEEPFQRRLLRLIVTHPASHIDEMGAIWLILRYGHHRFWWPEDRPPEIRYASGKEAERFVQEEEASIAIGILGGPFDEHRKEGRIPGTTAADLVARYLGVQDLPELRQFLSEIREADTRGGQSQLSVPTVLKTMASHGGRGDKFRMEYACAAFDALREKGLEFNYGCPREFDGPGRGKLEAIAGCRVAFVTSDLMTMAVWCRSSPDVRADIVVQFHTDGHAHVFGHVKSGRGQDDRRVKRNRRAVEQIARWIMLSESWIRQDPPERQKELDAELGELMSSGRGRDLPGSPHWYYMVEGGFLMNGGSSHPDKPATSMTREQIERGVRTALIASPDRQEKPSVRRHHAHG